MKKFAVVLSLIFLVGCGQQRIIIRAPSPKVTYYNYKADPISLTLPKLLTILITNLWHQSLKSIETGATSAVVIFLIIQPIARLYRSLVN